MEDTGRSDVSRVSFERRMMDQEKKKESEWEGGCPGWDGAW